MSTTDTSTNSGERTAGTICLWAGFIGAAFGLWMIVLTPAVGDDRWSYPFTASTFTVVQIAFFLQHLGLATGLLALRRASGPGRFGRGAVVASVIGMLLLAVMELVAISAKDSAYPTSRTDVIESAYGVVSMVIGLALVALGVAVLRAGRWVGGQRWIPLALGVYVFVPMTPGIFGPYWLARAVITGWMLLFALLGWAILRSGREHQVRG